MLLELPPGTDVEVKCTFDASWKRGFVVETTSEQGYLIRRRSDDSVLPTAFAPEAVRPADVVANRWT